MNGASVVVQVMEDGTVVDQIELYCGEELTFGSDCIWKAANLRVSGAAGSIIARGDHWKLTNFGSRWPIRVQNLIHGYERFRVRPRVQSTPVPFELCRVDGLSGHIFTVFGPEWKIASDDRCVHVENHGWMPRRDTVCNAVLRELCTSASRTGDQSSTSPPPPSSSTIARRLGLSTRAIDAQIDYLAYRAEMPTGAVLGNGWKRYALREWAWDRNLWLE